MKGQASYIFSWARVNSEALKPSFSAQKSAWLGIGKGCAISLPQKTGNIGYWKPKQLQEETGTDEDIYANFNDSLPVLNDRLCKQQL